MSTNVKKYFDRINQTEEELAKQDNRLKAEGANLSLQQEMLRVKKEISAQQIAIEAAKSNVSFSPKTIYGYNNQIQLLEREYDFYDKLQKELF